MSFGQTLDQRDLIEIVRTAFQNDKLPTELIPKLDSIGQLEFPDPFVVIKADSGMAIVREYDGSSNSKKVMIWEGEDIFLFNVRYWINLLEVERKGNIGTVKYRTTTYGYRDGEVTTCFIGHIKARLINGRWALIKSKFKRTECEFKNW